MKIFQLGLIVLSANAFAQSNEMKIKKLEVGSSVVHCASGIHLHSAEAVLNTFLTKDGFIAEATKPDEFTTVIVNKPYSVSAPAIAVRTDNNVTICVTVTKL